MSLHMVEKLSGSGHVDLTDSTVTHPLSFSFIVMEPRAQGFAVNSVPRCHSDTLLLNYYNIQNLEII